MTSEPALVVRDLFQEYRRGDEVVGVLTKLNWELEPGKSTAVMGASGSGKSTLLNLVAGFSRPTRGTIRWAGLGNLAELSDSARRQFYQCQVGFVFQRFNLMPDLTAFQNIVLALRLAGCPIREAEDAAHEAARRLGILPLLDRLPSDMSHGQAQRVAIARALAKNPRIIIADEPTGSVDRGNSEAVMDLMLELRRSTGGSLLIATHDERVAERCDQIVRISGGRLEV